MSGQNKKPPIPAGPLYPLAALVVIIAGLKAAAPLLVPFLLALFITLMLVPLMHWLTRRGVPKGFAFFLVVLLLFSLFTGLTGLLSAHIGDLFAHADAWQKAITENLRHWIERLQARGIEIDADIFFSMFQPGKFFTFTLSLVKNTSMLLSNSLLIFLTVVFMLVESFVIRQKIDYLEKVTGATGFAARIDRFNERINHYFALKTFTSGLTGIWIFLMLSYFDVPYPLLWGLGGFLLNFVPVIGSIIAAIPPVLLALATHGLSDALWIVGWFLIINIAIGNLLEPRIMGRGLELSELVVFLSLVFWGWIFGKVGMLLAIPLTMVVKFALETGDGSHWLAVLMSHSIPKEEVRK